MIFISGVISIIVQKNTLCTSKIRVIYFCRKCANFLPENIYFFLFFGVHLLPTPYPPPCHPAHTPTWHSYLFMLIWYRSLFNLPKYWRKRPKLLKDLQLSSPHKFEHSPWRAWSQSKIKIHWARNCNTHSHKFYEAQYDLRLGLAGRSVLNYEQLSFLSSFSSFGLFPRLLDRVVSGLY